jgi:hypothetical protein
MIRPVDMPKVRYELCRWYDERAEQFFKDNADASQGAPDKRARSGLRASSEAELYYVSPDMAELALAASKSMPGYALQPDDLPTPTGLLHSPTPLWQRTYPTDIRPGVTRDITYSYTGVMWHTWPPVEGAPLGGIAIGWLTDLRLYLEQVSDVPSLRDGAKALFPPLFEDSSMVFWPFEHEVVAEEDPAYMWSEAESPAFAVKTIWLLMGQPVASTFDAEYRRHDKRRLERQDIKPDPVRVITLRRPKTTTEHGESDREYHHQWIVRGHWRQQFYPKRGVSRPIWIAPHIKGPEGAPMLGGEKVYSWTR